MMKRSILYIIGVMLAFTAAAQTQFRTKELQRLATVLSLNVSNLPDGYCHPNVNGLRLTIHSQNQVVDHIGLQLFSDELRIATHSHIIDFLERYFLQLKYPPVVKTASNMIRDDQFRFLVGTLGTINQIRTTDNFAFNNDNHRYIAIWSRGGNTLLSVSFPVEYELISGENKIEAEENLLADINQTVVIPTKDEKSRNDSYIDECFSNRLYYQDGLLIASNQHPAESAANMMLSTNAPGQYSLNLTQISYGFKKKVFQVSLYKWISFCQNNGCQLYFGVEKITNKGDISAVVLAVNQEENYNHVLTVTIPAGAIDSHQGTIEARLYPYVPTHNVKNMFASFGKSNPKTIVSK